MIIKKNLVSVLITLYNEEKYIIQSLTSLINQSYNYWEAVIIDDASTDNTLKIIKKNFKDKRIKIFKLNKHIGRTPAINYGFKKCNGTFVAILDADDLYAKNKLEKQIEFLKKKPNIKLLASWVYLIKENKSIIKYKASKGYIKIRNELLFKNIIAFSSVIFNKTFAIKNNFFPLKLSYAQDYELILKFLKFSKLYILPNFLCKIQIRSNNMSNNPKNKMINIKDGLICLNYVKNNFNLNLKEKFFFIKSKFKIYLKIFLIKLRIF